MDDNNYKADDSKELLDDLVQVSMDIILNAGNAREEAQLAIQSIREKNNNDCEMHLKEAESYILKAHQSQTKVVQSEASGNKWPYLLLFNHAQDTLMTIMSEIKMSKEIILLYKTIYELLD